MSPNRPIRDRAICLAGKGGQEGGVQTIEKPVAADEPTLQIDRHRQNGGSKVWYAKMEYSRYTARRSGREYPRNIPFAPMRAASLSHIRTGSSFILSEHGFHLTLHVLHLSKQPLKFRVALVSVVLSADHRRQQRSPSIAGQRAEEVHFLKYFV